MRTCPKFTRLTRVRDTDVTHHFRIGSEGSFDGELRQWPKLAYEYGG